jgi:hypothetical protein
MNIRPDEMKICYNVLTGGIRVVSANGHFEYRRLSEPNASSQDRLKDLVALLKIVRKLRSRQTTLAGARKKCIEAQMFGQRH